MLHSSYYARYEGHIWDEPKPRGAEADKQVLLRGEIYQAEEEEAGAPEDHLMNSNLLVTNTKAVGAMEWTCGSAVEKRMPPCTSHNVHHKNNRPPPH